MLRSSGGRNDIWHRPLYVDPPNLGSVTGIVGAGGSVGAVAFGPTIRQLENNKKVSPIMGGVALGGSILSLFIAIDGHEGIIIGRKKGQVVVGGISKTIRSEHPTSSPLSKKLNKGLGGTIIP